MIGYRHEITEKQTVESKETSYDVVVDKTTLNLFGKQQRFQFRREKDDSLKSWLVSQTQR